MTSPRAIRTRLLSLAIKTALFILRHATFLRREDLSLILANNIEKLLNLPGKLPFFVTRTTEPERVRSLLNKLHPVSCSRELIRLGPDGDGGYLVPNDLEGIEACFSPGVSNIAGFEIECANRGMKVFMADASVENPPAVHSQFKFIRKFIGARTEGEFLSLEDWVSLEMENPKSELLLQMDIEGYEHEAILASTHSLLERFRIIVIEFHDLDYLFSAPLFPLYSLVFEKLLVTHTCVHIHPNNFCRPITVGNLELLSLAEFTFLRKDRISHPVSANKFPHPLDRDNTDKPGYSLPKSFYKS